MSSNSPALTFTVTHEVGPARVSKLELPHFTCDTPMFMPVGTYGALKGMTTQQLEELDCHTILGNTYHLGNRPTTELLAQMGGLHNYMNWNRSMLTDSGGFQMVSLLKLAEITEEGVTFQSPTDGSMMLLTPERSVQMQNEIGADILMALDDVVHSCTTGPRVEEAMYRTLRWIDRCISAHSRPTEQNLFGIVQGGLDEKLRAICLVEMVKRDLPGYAIGGLSGGEDKNSFWRVVHQCCQGLPKNKPRYLMGVGYPLDLVVCSSLGVDMYDCVYPARTARFGVALVMDGTMNLKRNEYATDLRPIEEDCGCPTCKLYTRAYLHSVVTKEGNASRLMTVHNIYYMMRLMREIRAAMAEGRWTEYVQAFVKRQFPNESDVPGWARDALAAVDIKV